MGRSWRNRFVRLTAVAVVGGGLIAVFGGAQPAGAKGRPKPTVSAFTATPPAVTDGDGWVTLSVTVVNATSCTFTSTESVNGLPSTFSCAGGTANVVFDLPVNSGKHSAKYTFKVAASGPGGTKSKTLKVTVGPGDGGTSGPLSNVVSVSNGGAGFCALLTTTGVDCWGEQVYANSSGYTELATAIPDTSGSGTLTGVTSLVSDQQGYCALMSSTGVDCWGANGQNDTPSPVDITGVTQLVSDELGSYCALLNSGAVDCWGQNDFGELGNGSNTTSDTPVAVNGVGGTGTLTGIQSLAGGYHSYCAITSDGGGLDCWGFNNEGELGIGTNGPDECGDLGCSTVPVEVDGGSLTGVTSVASSADGGSAGSWCAVLSDSSVTCWGWDSGASQGYSLPTLPEPDSPVSGITSLIGTSENVSQFGSYCGTASSGSVTCWRDGEDGELGNGLWSNSATDGYGAGETYFPPGPVAGVDGSGTLGGVSTITDAMYSYCALMSAGGVDCWGLNVSGQLGDGSWTGPDLCNSGEGTPCATTPQAVSSVDGSGTLSGVLSVSSDTDSTYCAVLTSGGVDCWGDNSAGDLGDGTLISSSTPVQVLAPLS